MQTIMTTEQMKRRLYANYSRYSKALTRSQFIARVAHFLISEGDGGGMEFTNDADLFDSFYWCEYVFAF